MEYQNRVSNRNRNYLSKHLVARKTGHRIVHMFTWYNCHSVYNESVEATGMFDVVPPLRIKIC